MDNCVRGEPTRALTPRKNKIIEAELIKWIGRGPCTGRLMFLDHGDDPCSVPGIYIPVNATSHNLRRGGRTIVTIVQ